MANIQGYPIIVAFTLCENFDAFIVAMDGWENRFIEVSGKDLLINCRAVRACLLLLTRCWWPLVCRCIFVFPML